MTSQYPSGIPGGLGPDYFSGNNPAQAPLTGGKFLTGMTAAQAAAMGMNLDGSPLSSSPGPASLGVVSGIGQLGQGFGSLGGILGPVAGQVPGLNQVPGLGQLGGAISGAGGDISKMSNVDSSAGLPVNITDPRAIADTGLTTLGGTIDKATKGLQDNTTTLTTAGTGYFNFLGNLFSGGTGIFARIGIGLLALMLVVAALLMMKNSKEGAI
jgi:hypothetical protein